MKFDFGNAFTLPAGRGLTAAETALLADLSGKIRARKMEDVAVFFLDSTRPVHYIGSQGLVFLMPILNTVCDKNKTQMYIDLLENPSAVEKLVSLLSGGATKTGE